MQLAGGIAPKPIAKLRQCDVVIINRRLILRLIEVIHGGKTEKAAFCRIHTRGGKCVAVGVDCIKLLILFPGILGIFFVIRQVAQLVKNRLLVTSQLGHLHGQQLVLFIICPKQIPLKLTHLPDHFIVLFNRDTKPKQLLHKLYQEEYEQDDQRKQKKVGHQQHNPIARSEILSVLLNDLHAHWEIEQIIQKIKE